MSKFVGVVIGGLEVVAALTIPGAQGLLIPGLLMIAGSTATLLLTPSGELGKRQAVQTTLQLGEVPRMAIFARCHFREAAE